MTMKHADLINRLRERAEWCALGDDDLLREAADALEAITGDGAPLPEVCALCGEAAEGFAMIGDKRYCHPDEGRSCYVTAERPFLDPPGHIRDAFAELYREIEAAADRAVDLLADDGEADEIVYVSPPKPRDHDWRKND